MTLRSPRSVHEGVTATAAGVTAARKDRSPTVHGRGRNRAVVQPVVKLVNFIGEALCDERILRGLGSGKILHGDGLPKLCDLVILGVDLILAQLILNALHTTVHGVQQSLRVLRFIGTGGTSFGCQGIPHVCDTIVHAVKALRVRRLLRKGTVQVGNFVAVKLLGNGVLRAVHGGVHSGETGTQTLLHAGEAGGDAVLNSAERTLDMLVAESVRDVFRVVQPRIEVIQSVSGAHAAHHHGPHHAAAKAAEAAPHAVPAQQKYQQEAPQVATEQPAIVAAIAIAVAIGRHDRHVKGSTIVVSHCLLIPFDLFILHRLCALTEKNQ